MTFRRAWVYWLDAPRQLRLADEPLPLPEAGHVVADTLVSAVSPGTELAAYRGAPPLRPGPVYPRLVGYCNVARITEVGDGVTDWSVGDRILTHSSHRSAFVSSADGILARIPEGLDDHTASLAYLMHLGYDAIVRGQVRAGHRVAVIGGGVLGLASVGMASLAGADVTLVTAFSVAGSVATQMGAARVVSRELSVDFAAACDVVISTTGGWQDWNLALDLAARRATIVVLGFPGREEPPGDINPLASATFYAKQLTIAAAGLAPERQDTRGNLTFNERDNLERLLRWMAQGRLPAHALISGIQRATSLAAVYASLESRQVTGTVVLDWSSHD
jgi:threonine dehydrogenase-like Zn-dependent dehydrogenase